VPAPVIVAQDLVKRYGEFAAVDGISFEVAPGESFGLLGPNGAGKSTTMRMVGAVSTRTSGDLAILGLDPDTHGPEIRSQLGVVPQADNLDAELRVRENLLVYGRYFGMPGRLVAKRADELLAFAQLEDKGKAKVDSLSGGMKRRLTIARALINDPRVLLLDEPTTGLDPALRLSFYEIVQELAQRGATVLLSSHALSELEERAERVIIMDRGRVVADGSVSELRRVACLPVRFRVHPGALPIVLPQGAGPVRTAAGGWVEIDVEAGSKIDVLRALVCSGAPDDLDIVPPSLDDLYAHFLRQSGTQA
jgi:lipooligosaccharide transport system ATP-binding protein